MENSVSQKIAQLMVENALGVALGVLACVGVYFWTKQREEREANHKKRNLDERRRRYIDEASRLARSNGRDEKLLLENIFHIRDRLKRAE